MALLQLLSRLYDEAAWRRRQWYACRPDAQRRLCRPTISVGALAVGGSGKTPLTAYLVQRLVAMGERPAVLSRGYGRVAPRDGVVVVRDHERVRGELATSGDEPWMLAQSPALEGAVVAVATDRFLAGHLAETHLGATVHLLDDGFQHLPLARGTDLVVVSAADLETPVVLPAGRLRERVSAVSFADAVFLVDVSAESREWLLARHSVSRVFTVLRRVGPVCLVPRTHQGGRLGPVTGPEPLAPGERVFAVAGMARPGRFFDALQRAGYQVVATRVFPDHYRYTRRTVERFQAEARSVGARAIVTTEKDCVRLLAFLPCDPPLATMSLAHEVPSDEGLDAFLAERLAAERVLNA